MLAIHRFPRFFTALLALALAPIAAAQSAAGPGQLVQECAAHMRMAADATAHDIGGITHQAVAHIQDLAAHGATAEQIAAAAHAAVDAIQTRAGQGAQNINTLAQNCAQMLQSMHAPPAAFAALHDAHDHALTAVAAAARAGTDAVIRAAHHAANPGADD